MGLTDKILVVKKTLTWLKKPKKDRYHWSSTSLRREKLYYRCRDVIPFADCEELVDIK